MLQALVLAISCLVATAAGAEPGPVAAPSPAPIGCGSAQTGLGSSKARADVDFVGLPPADFKASFGLEAEAAGRFSSPAWAGQIFALGDLVGGQVRSRSALAPNPEFGRAALSGQPIFSAFFGRLPPTATRNLIAAMGDASLGLAYAQKNCAACHNVLNSTAPSPNDNAPPFRTVANTPGMTITALTVWSRTSHPTMPNLVIEPPEMDNLIAYILSLRDRK